MQSKLRLSIERNNEILIGEELVLKAEIESHQRPGLRTQVQYPITRNDSQRELIKLVGILFGAGAEKQNEEYGDNHDPESCAKAGPDLYRKLLYKIDSIEGQQEFATKGLTMVEGAS